MFTFREIKLDNTPADVSTVVPNNVNGVVSVADLWVSADSLDSVDDNLPDILQMENLDVFENSDFFYQLAVTVGNFYKLILGKSQPKYCFGAIKDSNSPDDNLNLRFSKYIPNLMEFTTTNEGLPPVTSDEIDLSISPIVHINHMPLEPGTNCLIVDKEKNIRKPILNLMAVLALCLFFSDQDYKGDNVCLVEHEDHFQAIKIDPEAGMSGPFFNETQEDILHKILNIFETSFFRYYAFLLLQDYVNYQNYESVINDLFKSAKHEFFDTLNYIVDLPFEVIAKMFYDNIDIKYETQIDILIDAFEERQTYFQNALSKAKSLEETPPLTESAAIKSSISFLLNDPAPSASQNRPEENSPVIKHKGDVSDEGKKTKKAKISSIFSSPRLSEKIQPKLLENEEKQGIRP